MAIKVALAEEEVNVEPGGSAQVMAIIHNAGDRADHVALEVEGLDTEWCAIPIPSFTLEPGDEARERILIRPPRSSESRAGTYPFLVRARSLENGEAGVVQASLSIQPYNLLTLEIDPKHGTTSFWNKQTVYDVTVSNLGNTELNLQMFASDLEEACSFEFETERLKLAPGEAKTIWLQAKPNQVPVLSSPRVFGFTVSTRAVENPYLTASTQGQLERRALISPVAIWVAALFLVASLVWMFTRPHPVEIEEFKAEPAQITAGEKTNLQWKVDNADSIYIDPGGLRLDPQKARAIDVQPTTSTEYTLTAENRFGRLEKKVMVTVSNAPAPTIEAFTAEPANVKRGDAVLLRWKVNNATEVYVVPPGGKVDPAQSGMEHLPTRDTTYELIVKNQAGQTVSKKVSVTVFEPSMAQIIAFTADAAKITRGETVKLTWDVRNASKVEISGIGVVDSVSGEQIVQPAQTINYRLTATDANGRTSTATVNVRVDPPPTPSDSLESNETPPTQPGAMPNRPTEPPGG